MMRKTRFPWEIMLIWWVFCVAWLEINTQKLGNFDTDLYILYLFQIGIFADATLLLSFYPPHGYHVSPPSTNHCNVSVPNCTILYYVLKTIQNQTWSLCNIFFFHRFFFCCFFYVKCVHSIQLSNAIREMFHQNVNWKIEIKQSCSEALALDIRFVLVNSPCR